MSQSPEPQQYASRANDESIAPATVRPGHGYPADRVETSPSQTGWRGSGADEHLKQRDPIPGSFSSVNSSKATGEEA